LPRAGRESYDGYEALLRGYHEKGWTDGLPIVPPTAERVEAFLAAAGLGPDEILGTVPTREVVTTAEACAVNAVMAGCLAEYAPVVMAAVRAHLEEKANCHSSTGTLTGAAHAVIVHGPVRREVGISCRAGCFGPGARANATIGRALRLVIRNVCRAVPGGLDRATFSKPARYSFCFGEDEEGSDWIPMHEERGFPAGSSAVTVHSNTDRYAAWDTEMSSPESLLDIFVQTARAREIRQDDWLGEERNMVIVVGPEHRDFLVSSGWSKRDVREYLFPRLTQPSGGGEERHHLHRADGILIVAAGGPGMAESWILYPHLALATTKPV
jgi:hypothetical protein